MQISLLNITKMSLPESVWQIFLWNTCHQLFERMEEFHFTDLGSDGKKKEKRRKEIRNSDRKKKSETHCSQQYIPGEHFWYRNYVHISKNAKVLHNLSFPTPSELPSCLFPLFSMSYWQRAALPPCPSQRCQFAENIWTSPRCYLCETALSCQLRTAAMCSQAQNWSNKHRETPKACSKKNHLRIIQNK